MEVWVQSTVLRACAKSRPGSRARSRRVLGPGEPLRILFVLDHPGMLQHFDNTVSELLRHGHTVQLAFGRADKITEGMKTVDRSHPHLTVCESPAPIRTGRYATVAEILRAAADYIHYLHPSMVRAEYSRAKWRKAPLVPSRLRNLRRMGAKRAQLALWLLRACERALPSDRRVESFIDAAKPDLVLVTPLVSQQYYQTDIVGSARALGIPSALCVGSWDHLTSKGRIRIVPDRVIVWNETQRQEATEMHEVPLHRVVATGAQQFDRWFGRVPRATRSEFCSRFGLPLDKPYVLYVGQTRQHLGRSEEAEFARAWVSKIRAASDPAVRDVSVLLRPHPVTIDGWRDVDLSDLAAVALWDRDRPLPILEDDRADYFDGLYHSAAVVGLNSSAMVEAAIIGRPVHSIALPRFYESQGAMIHYSYLLPEAGGFLTEARDLDEHLSLLAADLRNAQAGRERQLRFVEAFVRPKGLDTPATSVLVSTIEDAARIEPEDLMPVPVRGVIRCGLLVGASFLRASEALRLRIGAGRRAASRWIGTRAKRVGRSTVPTRPGARAKRRVVMAMMALSRALANKPPPGRGSTVGQRSARVRPTGADSPDRK